MTLFRNHLESGTKMVLEHLDISTKNWDLTQNSFATRNIMHGNSLTTHEIPDFMTLFWHPNCMTSLRGHRTPLPLIIAIPAGRRQGAIASQVSKIWAKLEFIEQR